MSSNDSSALSQLGSILIIKVVRIAFEATFYGAYILLIAASTTILCRGGLRSPWKIYLLCITLLMFAGSSLFMVMDTADLVEQLKVVFTGGTSSDTIQNRIQLANDKIQFYTWTEEILFVFMLILGDTVVLWRTWAIYYGKRIYVILPFLTWLGSTVAGIYELGCDIRTKWSFLDPDPSAGSQGARSCARADISSFTLSYATNIICTILIFLRTWRLRRSMRKYLGSARPDVQAEKIMVLLVESGLLYLIIYTLQAVPIFVGYNPGSVIVWEIVNAIIQQAFGMYPTAIVVLVELQRSLWETDEVSRELTGMAFNSNPNASTSTHTMPAIGDSGSGSPQSQFSRKKIDF
ncbi:hypothetical protein APHAL10511_004058 [Amanita phalloides]|nr:hypothetical protein APHAL10511_004058 [Amanita phalloides]